MAGGFFRVAGFRVAVFRVAVFNNLRIPLKQGFCLHRGEFFRCFRADTGGSVKTAKIWSEVIRKPP
jgi:hypothetical protein